MAWTKYLNPLYPVTRAYSDVKASSKSIAYALQTLRRKREANDQVVDDGTTPSERFAMRVREDGWTPDELYTQGRAFRRARLFFLGAIVVGCPAFITIAFFCDWWIAAMILVSTCFYVAVFSALSAKHAWMEWQISIQSFEPFKVFAAREDFFSKTFML